MSDINRFFEIHNITDFDKNDDIIKFKIDGASYLLNLKNQDNFEFKFKSSTSDNYVHVCDFMLSDDNSLYAKIYHKYEDIYGQSSFKDDEYDKFYPYILYNLLFECFKPDDAFISSKER